MSVSIRALQDGDRKVWEQQFQAYAEFYKTSVPNGGFDTVWTWIFDPDNPFWCAVAVNEGGEIIGFTQYQLMHRSLGGSMVCYLSDLYVNPDIRGSGAGRALIDHVIDFAKERNIPNVRWLTQEFNHTARQLYDRIGVLTPFIKYNRP